MTRISEKTKTKGQRQRQRRGGTRGRVQLLFYLLQVIVLLQYYYHYNDNTTIFKTLQRFTIYNPNTATTTPPPADADSLSSLLNTFSLGRVSLTCFLSAKLPTMARTTKTKEDRKRNLNELAQVITCVTCQIPPFVDPKYSRSKSSISNRSNCLMKVGQFSRTESNWRILCDDELKHWPVIQVFSSSLHVHGPWMSVGVLKACL